MSIETAIVARVAAYSGLSALVGTRIFPQGTAEQETTKPYLTYSKISAVRQSTMGKRARIVRARIQIDVYAATKLSAIAVRTQVINAFDNWSGTSDSITIQYSTLDTEMDTTELEGTETEVKRETLTFLISYNNPEAD